MKLRIPVTENIARLRLHNGTPSPATTDGQRAIWLLSLRDQQKKRAADSAALHALVAAVSDTLDALPAMVGQRLDGVAETAVELGLAVAREILGDALDSGAVDVTATVARCLRDCTHGSGATELSVHLHPDDLEIAQQKIAEFDELVDRLSATRFVADARAARGVVRIETEAGRLKYDPRDVLQRISESVRRQVRA